MMKVFGLINMHIYPSIRWICALPSEAYPIINLFKLKLIHDLQPYMTYRNEIGSHWLTISGVGGINCAAATTFLYIHSKADRS